MATINALTSLNSIKAGESIFTKQTKYKTGFTKLDTELGGGLRPGICCIGGVPGLGKTTFVMQIARNLAKDEKNVLVFALEMKADALISKAISRDAFVKYGLKMTVDDVFQSIKNNDTEKLAPVYQRIERYAQNIDFVEAGGNPITAAEISKKTDEWVSEHNGTVPVIIVDYLQIVAPVNEKNADKQNVDASLRAFKTLSEKYNAVIILINSFNRDSYDTEVSMKSFKDSGGIEYTADTMLGMQLHGVGGKGFLTRRAMAKYPREIDLVVLKQRYGQTGGVVQYGFYTPYNALLEHGVKEIDTEPDEKKYKIF